MKIIKPSIKIISKIDYMDILSKISNAGRTCYKSEKTDTRDGMEAFIRKIIKSGHTSVIEHESISVRIICDRGVSHELVRHRIASFSQESTRYCDYSKGKFGRELTFIWPCWFDERLREIEINRKFLTETQFDNWKQGRFGGDEELYDQYYSYEAWHNSCAIAEENYLAMMVLGSSAQEARSVLPNSLKTELVMTANLREWRHFCKIRTTPACHPQMTEISFMILNQFKEYLPVFFEDIKQ